LVSSIGVREEAAGVPEPGAPATVADADATDGDGQALAAVVRRRVLAEAQATGERETVAGAQGGEARRQRGERLARNAAPLAVDRRQPRSIPVAVGQGVATRDVHVVGAARRDRHRGDGDDEEGALTICSCYLQA
jgi:hypothetical protein